MQLLQFHHAPPHHLPDRKGSSRKWLISILLMAALIWGHPQDHAIATEPAPMPIYQFQQTAFVKLEDVMKQFGGQIEKDPGKNRMVYTPQSLQNLVSRVSPSVVGIIGNFSNASKTDRFNLAHGTGFVIKEDGWIVTNAHVVNGLSSFLVVTSDGKQYDGVLKSMDEESDLALVKIKATKLKPVTFAAKEPKPGEAVFAVGTPISFSLRNSVTSGVVSGTNRSVSGNYKMIQTDTAINPGNSGGPLLNYKGEVVGVNSLKLADADIDNLGFAIPAATAKRIISLLMTEGKVVHPSVGFDVEESFEAIVGLPVKNPLLITYVPEDSDAQQNGIAEGDELIAVNNKAVTSLVDLKEILLYQKTGKSVKLKIRSAGQFRTVTVKLTASEK